MEKVVRSRNRTGSVGTFGNDSRVLPTLPSALEEGVVKSVPKRL